MEFKYLPADRADNALALHDGGWRSTDKDMLMHEYDLTEEQAEELCGDLEAVEDYLGKVVDEDGYEVNYEGAVALMDDEIREAVHFKLGSCSNQAFYNAYCEEHFKKYGEHFEVN